MLRSACRGVARIVRDHADRGAGLVQLLEQVHDGFAALRIEVARRLVGEQDERLAGDGAGDGDALLLAAGELARQMLRAMRHADALERRLDALLALGRAHAAVGERQLDVLEDGEIADQVEALKDEPDLAVAHARARRRGARRPAGCSAGTALRSASRAGRGSTAASTCRSPTARRSTRIRPCRSPCARPRARAFPLRR